MTQSQPPTAQGDGKLPTAPKEKSRQTVLLDFLNDKRDALKAVLSKEVSPERIMRLVLMEVRKNPLLLKSTPASIFASVVEASRLNLELGATLGHAYIVPFWNNKLNSYEAIFIVGYRGMITLARRSGEISTIHAKTVFAGDDFNYEYGLIPKLTHTPWEMRPAADRPAEKGASVAYYAAATLKDGTHQFKVMWREETEAVRDKYSQSYKNSKTRPYSPWHTHFDEQSEKTTVRRLFKFLPVSIEAQKAAGIDEWGEERAGDGRQDLAGYEALLDGTEDLAGQMDEDRAEKRKGNAGLGDALGTSEEVKEGAFEDTAPGASDKKAPLPGAETIEPLLKSKEPGPRAEELMKLVGQTAQIDTAENVEAMVDLVNADTTLTNEERGTLLRSCSIRMDGLTGNGEGQ